MKDSERANVTAFIEEKVTINAKDIDEVYAYMFGNVGFIRFLSEKAMWSFIPQYNKNPKQRYEGRELWMSTSKNPQERKRANHLGKFKRVLIEVGVADAESVRIDYRRGFVFLKKSV